MTELVDVDDVDFAWMLGGACGCRALRLPPGGVDEPVILRHVRDIVRRLHLAGCRGGWMIVSGDEVVGLCSYKRPPEGGAVAVPAHNGG